MQEERGGVHLHGATEQTVQDPYISGGKKISVSMAVLEKYGKPGTTEERVERAKQGSGVNAFTGMTGNSLE